MTTKIVYFPAASTEYWVYPEGENEQINCYVPPQDLELTVQQTSGEYYTEYCSNCPLYLDDKEFIANYRAKGYSTISGREEVARIIREEQRCTATQEEQQHQCNWSEAPGFEAEIPVVIKTYESLWRFYPNKNKRNIAELYVANRNEEDTHKISVKPYLISNVYPDGACCWGNNRKPANLKEAYNTFWGSVFTPSLTENIQRSLAHTIKTFDPQDVKSPWQSVDLSECVYSGKHQDGVLYSDAEKIVSIVPEEYRYSEKLVCGFFNKVSDNAWMINFNGFIVYRNGSLSSSGNYFPLGNKEFVLSLFDETPDAHSSAELSLS